MKLNSLIILAIVSIVVLLILGRFYFSEASFSTTNPFWNSIGTFSSVFDTENIYDLGELSNLGAGSTLIVVGPTVNYTYDDSQYIKEYLERGGKVVVMDDYGCSDSLLSGLDSPITLYQKPLCQDTDYYVRPSFPLITNISEPYNASEIMLNHPVSLNTTGDCEIIATTTQLGWIDANDNCYLDLNEDMGVYAVIASATYGSGTLVVVGDADMITNGMIYRSNNKAFLSLLLGNSRVYIDMTHGHGVPPLARLQYILKYDIVSQLLLTVAVIASGYAYHRRADIIGLFRRSDSAGEDEGDRKESILAILKSKYLLKDSKLRELNKKL